MIIDSNILEEHTYAIVGTVVKESVLASVPKQTDSHLLQLRDMGCFWELPTLVAWLSSTWLAQILLYSRSKVQNLKHFLNRTDTHHKLGQHKQHSNYICTTTYIFVQPIRIPIGELKRASWPRTTLSDTLIPSSEFGLDPITTRGFKISVKFKLYEIGVQKFNCI